MRRETIPQLRDEKVRLSHFTNNNMKMKKILFMKTRFSCIILLIILSTGYITNAQKVFTLKQCVDTAIGYNLLVKQSDLKMQNASITY